MLWLFGGGPGLNFDFATLSCHVPNLDSSCARRLCNTAGRGEETGFQVEQRNRSRKQERKIGALKPLDNKSPIQGASGSNREAESTDAPERGGLPRSSDEAG